jgi:hypothetical protein
MKRHTFVFSAVILSLFFYTQGAYAHCDTMDGPVVIDAQKAFEEKNVNYVLKWVKADDEAVVKQAFDLVMKVRPINSEAKQLAEKYFYDVLVRIHRAAEGVPFTGVKPSGSFVDEKVKEADKSLVTGSLVTLEKMVPKNRIPELKERFNKVMAVKKFDVNNVKAGREYIEAYVQFFKYAEGEEGHGHGEAGSESLHILIISLIFLTGLFFISTMFFGIRYFKLKKIN